MPGTELEIDFSDLEKQFTVSLNSAVDSVVCIDNAPVVDESKKDKLLAVIGKLFKQFEPLDTFMPFDKEKSLGFLFMRFGNAENADAAVKRMHGHKLDKSHVLSVFHFQEIPDFAELDDEYQEPEIEPFEEKGHLKSWLADERSRDQFAIVHGDNVSIYWNNRAGAPQQTETREYWTNTSVSWSAKGSYLVSYHLQGIILYGGPAWKKICRMEHPNVKLVDFSPNEKYVITFSPEPFDTPFGAAHVH
jgi:translation initiation factor 3 subunit B